MKISYDVIVVGMGPVGAVSALLLAKEGLSVLVVDQEPEPFDKPRAIGIDHDALRLLQGVGVMADFEGLLGAYQPSEYRSADGALLRRIVPQPEPHPQAWPPYSTFVQPELEGLLRLKCEQSPLVDVRLGWKAEAFDQDDVGARISLVETASGIRKSVSAHYVIGCDGARSAVREFVGGGVEDLDFDEPWLVVDVVAAAEVRLPETIVQYCDPARPATFIAGPRNVKRWEIMLLPGEDPAEMVGPDKVWSLLSPWISPDEGELWRAATYRFHAIVARKWRSGRYFLAGDAAHQTPPFMAQGLNQGLRDCANLCWKIGQVLRHDADAKLLDSYEVERRPNVREVIALTKDLGKIICELDSQHAGERNARMLAEVDAGRGEIVRQNLLPDLNGGFLLSPNEPLGRASGSTFPQPVIASQGQLQRMDDLLAGRFVLVVAGAWSPTAKQQEFAGRVGVSFVSFAAPADVGVRFLSDASGVAAEWMIARGLRSVLVRPDHIVFGAGAKEADADELLTLLGSMLNPN